MNKQLLSQWAGVLFTLFLILVVLAISYRKDSEGSGSLAGTSKQTLGDHVTSKVPLADRQCATLLNQRGTQKSRFDIPDDIPDWLDVRLRINSSQTRLFPFPKVYESDSQGLLTRLSISSEFQMHFQYDGSMSLAMTDRVKLIVDRVCLGTVSGVQAQHAASSTPVAHIHVTFTSSKLIATSSAMKNILHQRSEEAKKNAQYIDDEMYTLNVSQEGVVYIMVHTSAETDSATHRGLANAFATLDQLFNQPIPVQLPLSIIDWPDNHWRGDPPASLHFIYC